MSLIPWQIQAITYQEYLPLILGPTKMEEYGLDIGQGPTVYDPEEDPRITNEFATVAFRFGHSQVDHEFRPFVHGKQAPNPKGNLGKTNFTTIWPLHLSYFNFKGFVLVEGGR